MDQEMYKMILEHFVKPKTKNSKTTVDRYKGFKSQLEEILSSQIWNNLRINKNNNCNGFKN